MVAKADDTLHRLFRRCVECPQDSPACPPCKSSESCVLIPQSCNACASTQCQSVTNLPGQLVSKSSTPIGAIVGGVLAGLAVILIGVFLVWHFCIKPRRRKDTWDPPEKRDQANLVRGGSREHSIASTVLTRASNVIQIAYIPGVTGRSPPVSPNSVPPMPNMTPHGTPQPDTHFFMPGDLRDSTWSDNSDNRISLTPSLARASATTTLHRTDSSAPVQPAQQALRAQPNIVNLKPGLAASSTPVRSSPLAPKQININNSSIVARNVTARPIEVKKAGTGPRIPTLGNLARANSAKSTGVGSKDKPAELDVEKETIMSPVTDICDSPMTPNHPVLAPTLATQRSEDSVATASASGVSNLSPSDAAGRGVTHRHTNSGGLAALIEDAIKNASADTRRPGPPRANSGPFSDVHELPSSSP